MGVRVLGCSWVLLCACLGVRGVSCIPTPSSRGLSKFWRTSGFPHLMQDIQAPGCAP